MNATGGANDDSPKLPTRSQLQAEAFGLSPRTPEWLRAERLPGASHPQQHPQGPSQDDAWVIAASKSDGWVLERFSALLERHSIEAEIDRRAGLLRVRRSALRAACHLLRTHRRELRVSKAAKERQTVDAVFIWMVGPPVVLSAITFAVLAALVTSPIDNRYQDLGWLLTLCLICFTVVLSVRAAVAAVCWLRRKPRQSYAAQPGREHADYPPAP